MSGTLHFPERSVSMTIDSVQQALDTGSAPWEKAVLQSLLDWLSDEAVLHVPTSGSTGPPQHITLSKEFMASGAARTVRFFDIKRGARAFFALPTQYIGGLMMLVRGAMFDWELWCAPPGHVPNFPKEISFDFVVMTPAQAFGCCQDEAALRAMSNWRVLLLGGSSVGLELVDRLPSGPHIFESFGMTETASHFAVRRILPIAESAFECLPEIHVELAPSGNLVVHIPSCEPLQTRDVIAVDSPNRFRHLGRSDDVINSGGVKVHPQEVERALRELISEPFVVYGRPHPVWGEEVVIRVHAERAPGNCNELKSQWLEHAQEHLIRPHHAPRDVEWKLLKQTPTGKWIRPDKNNL